MNDINKLIEPSWVSGNRWVENRTIEEYHADKTHVSASSLKEAVRSSPKHFLHAFTAASKKPTDAMNLGRLAHMAVLEGAKFAERYVVLPEFEAPTLDGKMSKQSKAAKEMRDEFVRSLPDTAVLVTKQEQEKITGMIESILSHQKASDFLLSGISELSGYYRDDDTGINCRVRPDFMCTRRGIIAEFKTTENCSEDSFRWDVFGDGKRSYWYDFQLAMQVEGFRQIEGRAPEVAAWVAVESAPPYDVAVHVATIPVLDIGQIKYRRALKLLRECITSEKWPGRQDGDDCSLIVPTDAIMDKYGVGFDTEKLL